MSRHRQQPPPRYQTRYGRVVVLGVSLTTTAIALLGGVGVLPSAAGDDDEPAGGPRAAVAAADTDNPADPPDTLADTLADPGPSTTPTAPSSPEVAPEPTPDPEAPTVDETLVPPDSGEGRRVVFSESLQRVWLVDEKERVERTYLVSGSLTDNLDPGTYEVYSRSEDAIGIDDSGTMKWFVRFTQGDTGAAIGFHDIPVDDGQRIQTKSQLGTPQSHGCIRQATPDAKAMWDFAPDGTTVVVV